MSRKRQAARKNSRGPIDGAGNLIALGERSRRGRVALVVAGLALAVGVLVVAGAGAAVGADTKLTNAKAVIDGGSVAESKRAALMDIADLDSSSGHEALEAYADAKDEKLAAFALLTIGKADYSGARGKLEKVFEDAKRPHAARVAAFLALSRLRAKDGDSWDQIASYAGNHVKDGTPLADSVAAAKNALFPSTKEGK